MRWGPLLVVAGLFACGGGGGGGPTAPISNPPAQPPAVLSVGGQYTVTSTFVASTCGESAEDAAGSLVVVHQAGSSALRVDVEGFALPGDINSDGSFSVLARTINIVLETRAVTGGFTSGGFSGDFTLDTMLQDPISGRHIIPCTFHWRWVGTRQSGQNSFP